MFSDCGARLNAMRTAAKDITENYKPEFVVFAGDLKRFPCLQEWNYIVREMHKSFGGLPLYATPGNHDYDRDNPWTFHYWEMFFGSGEDSWGFGDTLFVTFNTSDVRISNPQFERLERVLKENRKDYRRCVLITHTPMYDPYVSGTYALPTKDAARLRNLCRENSVDMLVCGHIHVFTDTAIQQPEYADFDFGGTRMIILPPCGQRLRDKTNPFHGYARFDFRKDGSIDVAPVYQPADDDFDGFLFLLYSTANYKAMLFSAALGTLLGGALLFLILKFVERKLKR